MRVFTSAEDVRQEIRRCAVAIGKFDGLHLGHARLLARLVECAKNKGVCALALTFDPSPVQILRPDLPFAQLCDLDEKLALLERANVDAVLLCQTTRDFLNQTADDFFQTLIVEQLRAVALVEGENFSFGKGREGRGEKLRALCRDADVELDVVPRLEIDGAPVSSSAVRRALARGDVADAAKRLGRPYRLKGVVGRGDARGRRLGFPTANLVRTTSASPQAALYAAFAILPDGRRKSAAVNVGGNPTFGVDAFKIEAHLLDFSGDLYDQPLALDFVQKLRDVQTFPSKDALARQMADDLARVKRVLEDAAR